MTAYWITTPASVSRQHRSPAIGPPSPALPPPLSVPSPWRRQRTGGIFWQKNSAASAWGFSYVLAEQDGELLTVYDAFAPAPLPLLELCRAFGPSVRRVEFAFTPAGRDGLEEYEYHAEDTTLFISGSPLAQDLERVRGFPELAHA